MTAAEKEYRSTSKRIGVLLLLMLALFFVRSLLLFGFGLFALFLPPVVYDTSFQLLDALLYALCFLIPAFVFPAVSFGERIEPIALERRLPRSTPFYLLAGLAVLITASAINSYMLSFLDYGNFSAEFFVPMETATNRQIVLQLITVAVVPAFAEEFLFRGVILTNLAPYGKASAVVTSAILFGLMHQNAGQLFFATVAGLVFGFLYVTLGTIWVPVLLHLVNNFYVVLSQVLIERLPPSTVNAFLMILQTAIFALGLLSFIYLMQKKEWQTVKEEPRFRVTPARQFRLFCSAPTVIYCVLCIALILLYLVLSIVLY